MKKFYLKRKDDIIALLNLTIDGYIDDFTLYDNTIHLAPIHDSNNKNWLKDWWNRRCVPISQGHIKKMLIKKGISTTNDYLVKNLGLSLVDYYWICPVDTNLYWKDVNLFDNDFYDDINICNASSETNSNHISHYTPNSSLQGTLEKCWTIRNGKRGMIKGNTNSFSQESFNEIIASKLHELQGFSNYTPYKLIAFSNKPYQYGCFSELFTSKEYELVSAYDIIISKKKKSDTNTYEHFITVCKELGLSEDILRPFLEYQIMTDFILSNRDRHLSNISILRDAKTLKLTKPAPIYDTGKSMFVNDFIPDSDKEMLKIQTESFSSNELSLLSLVKDKSLVNINKIPDTKFIKDLYSLDTNMSESRINAIIKGYEKKIDLFRRWQQGEDLKALTYKRNSKKDTSSLKDYFA